MTLFTDETREFLSVDFSAKVQVNQVCLVTSGSCAFFNMFISVMMLS